MCCILLVPLAAAVAAAGNDGKSDDLERSRNRRRSREERGLPTREVLIDLARTYFREQAKLWPELVEAGAISAATPDALEEFADQFEEKFRNRTVTTVVSPLIAGKAVDLAASYLRYSDDNSNSRSLAQQLILQLNKARQLKDFIQVATAAGGYLYWGIQKQASVGGDPYAFSLDNIAISVPEPATVLLAALLAAAHPTRRRWT